MNCSFAEFVEIYSSTIKKNDPRFRRLPSGLFTPAKHIEVCQFLEANQEGIRLLMAHREFSKSYLVTLYPVWKLYQDPDYTCAFIAATGTISRRNAAFVKAIIESHPLTKNLVPEDDSLWQRTQFTVAGQTPGLEASVVCSSVSASKTGLHPREVICDDLEVLENCNSEEAREKLRDCFNELMNLSSNILIIGTPHDEKTIYQDIEDQGAVTLKIPIFGYNELGVPYDSIEEGGCLQLPEIRSKEWADNKRKLLKTTVWESQFKLIPRAAYDVILDPDLLIPFTGKCEVVSIPFMSSLTRSRPELVVNKETVRDLKAFWDPAMGTKNRDNSVLAVVCSTYEGNVYILALETLPEVSKEYGFDSQMERVLAVCAEQNCNDVFVEVNFVRTLATELKRFAKAKNKKIKIHESVRSANKKDFIGDHIEPLLKVQRLYVNPKILVDTKLKSEMRGFPKGHEDDHIDAIAGCIQELKVPGVHFAKTDTWLANSFRRGPTITQVN